MFETLGMGGGRLWAAVGCAFENLKGGKGGMGAGGRGGLLRGLVSGCLFNRFFFLRTYDKTTAFTFWLYMVDGILFPSVGTGKDSNSVGGRLYLELDEL